jgi:hypothetical protein
MGVYADQLRQHLAAYKRERLGVQIDGLWLKDSRTYPHILPEDLRWLNLHETIRAEFLAYWERGTPRFALHRDFHHLTSSQAMAVNLLFPWFGLGVPPDGLLRALELDSPVTSWAFEHVPDEAEGTNLDFHCVLAAKAEVHVEVKLAESGFGQAQADARHRQKWTETYRPRLAGKVGREIEIDEGLRHYQLLRIVSGLDLSRGDQARLILPRANDALRGGIQFLHGVLAPACSKSIRVVYLEDLIPALGRLAPCPRLATHVVLFAEKYLSGEALAGSGRTTGRAAAR